MIGWALRTLVVWGALAALLYALGGQLLSNQQNAADPAPTSSAARSPAATRTSGAVPNSLVYRANKDGHVYVDAVVNGAPVKFVVDTGATMVVLTVRDAAAAGLSRGSLSFDMRTSTANGIGRAAPVRLHELRLGQLSVSDVPAAVVENLGLSLLGQSFLTRLDSYEMRDGALTLNYW